MAGLERFNDRIEAIVSGKELPPNEAIGYAATRWREERAKRDQAVGALNNARQQIAQIERGVSEIEGMMAGYVTDMQRHLEKAEATATPSPDKMPAPIKPKGKPGRKPKSASLPPPVASSTMPPPPSIPPPPVSQMGVADASNLPSPADNVTTLTKSRKPPKAS